MLTAIPVILPFATTGNTTTHMQSPQTAQLGVQSLLMGTTAKMVSENREIVKNKAPSCKQLTLV